MAGKKKVGAKKKEVVKPEVSSLKDDEPSWYHYLIVLAVFALIGFGIFFLLDYFDSKQDVSDGINNRSVYTYKHVVGNVTYNIEFSRSPEEIAALEYDIDLNENDLFNTASFKFAFDEYNGTDNGQISVAAIKLKRFLDKVYFFSFTNESFVTTDILNCSNSTPTKRVVLFDPYSNESGVELTENGCVIFEATRPEDMRVVVDKFIYEVVTGE